MNNHNPATTARNEINRRTDLTFKTFSTACRTMLEDLKNRLTSQLTTEFTNVDGRLVRRAVNEAWAIAYLSPVPQLVLPTLAEEKVQKLRDWTIRQRAIFQNQHTALAA